MSKRTVFILSGSSILRPMAGHRMADMVREVESRVNGVMGDDGDNGSAAAAAPEGAARTGDD